MNIQKFTQKSMEAVSGCEKLAYEYGNQEIEQEHLLAAAAGAGGWSDSGADQEDGDQSGTF